MNLSLFLAGWSDYFKKVFGDGSDAYNAASSVITTVETVLWILVGIVGLAGVVYAIYLGIQLARAEDQSKRDEAKKHLITVLIALVVTLVLIVFFLYLLPLILSAFKTGAVVTTPNNPAGQG